MDVGRQRIRGHLLHGVRGQYSCAVELAAVEQHLAEAQIVGCSRDQPAAAGEHLARLGHIEGGIARLRRLDQAAKRRLRHMKAGIHHMQRTEDAVLEELVEWLFRRDLDDVRQHVDPPTVFPDLPGLMRQWQIRKAGDEFGQGILAAEMCLSINPVNR